jgi:hypothetical protein
MFFGGSLLRREFVTAGVCYGGSSCKVQRGGGIGDVLCVIMLMKVVWSALLFLSSSAVS